MKSLKDIIRAGNPQGTGVEYFVSNPTEFVALIKVEKQGLNLAHDYVVTSPSVFTTHEVRKMLRNAYETSFSKPFQSFFCELVAVLNGFRPKHQEEAIKLSSVIITLLNQLGTGNLLDPEFPNDSLAGLMKQGHYQVCAAILLHLSPVVAASALQVKFNNTQDVFQKMISDLPNSYSAVKQAIDALKDLNTLDTKAFEVFIQAPRTGDLLQALKDKSVHLANTFHAINTRAINNQFRASSQGFPMELTACAPPPYNSQQTAEMSLIAFKLGDKERLPVVTPEQYQNKGECRII